MSFNLPERFWKKVRKAGPEQCWQWTGCKRNGYGRFRHQGTLLTAHRLMAQSIGLDVCEKVIRHKCDNPACVNPRHLVAGTQLDNVKDRDSRNRGVFLTGDRNGNAKLSTGEVSLIRANYASARRTPSGRVARGTVSNIALAIGIDRATIYQIINRKTWEGI